MNDSANMDAFTNKLTNVCNFDPTSIRDLSHKVIIVTGGNADVGKQTVLELVKHRPERLYLTARSQAKYNAAMKDIKEAVPEAKVEFLEMDLASLASVDAAAKKVLAENDKLDILINNAGIMAVPHATTKDGYEMHFGTNHMGHALLTRQLLPLLSKTATLPDSDVRIVDVTSAGHMMAPGRGVLFDKVKSDMKGTHEYTLYGQSKMANVLHAKALAKRYPEITSVSVHPGRVNTGLLDHYSGMMMQFQKVYDWVVGAFTTEQGALNQLWAGFGAKSDIENGAYYIPIGKKAKGDKRIHDEKLVDELWDWQEAEFKKLGYS